MEWRESSFHVQNDRLQGMGQGIDSIKAVTLWLGESEFQVEHGETWQGFSVSAGHFAMRSVIGNQREGLAFASRSCSCGNGNQWQHRMLRLTNTPGNRHTAPIGENEIASLGRIHGASATKADKQFNLRMLQLQREACTLESVGFSMD